MLAFMHLMVKEWMVHATEIHVYLIHIGIILFNSHVLSNGLQHLLRWHNTLFMYIYLFGRCFYPPIQLKRYAGVCGRRVFYFSGLRVSIWHSRDSLAFIRSVRWPYQSSYNSAVWGMSSGLRFLFLISILLA